MSSSPPSPDSPHRPGTSPIASPQAGSGGATTPFRHRHQVVLRVCPDCSGPLARTSGCATCLTCGWSRCG